MTSSCDAEPLLCVVTESQLGALLYIYDVIVKLVQVGPTRVHHQSALSSP